jgi:hypothetical protein
VHEQVGPQPERGGHDVFVASGVVDEVDALFRGEAAP